MIKNTYEEILMDNEIVEDLKKRMDNLQYKELQHLKDEINNIKVNLAENNLLTKQCTESNEKMSNTLDSLKETMISVAQSVKDSNKISSELAETVKNLNNKVTSVENKMDNKFEDVYKKVNKVDDKAKIDIAKWLKDNWFGAVMAIGAIAYIISQMLR